MMSRAFGARTVHTIGHSTLTLAEFTRLLKQSAIEIVVDVRSYPRSRRHPQFNIDTLPQSLSALGVGYEHIAELGGRRRRPRDAPPSPNTFWRNDSFRNYADYAMTEPFRIGMARLRTTVDRGRSAVMCSEALWWRCHRRIISDYLLTEGFEVLHIMGASTPAPAALTPAVEQLPDGTLIYADR
jgi:uncharacterized protein (DUF488 family)